ncbi:hypothetical protein [Nocardia testacea]|uniref:hypothetical protein n=1 Tax=Nocardia testacea TaxID=248551 RepID=UPI003A864181
MMALPDATTLHLHATDPGLGTEGEWTVRSTDASITWNHTHTQATTVVEATASVLLLTLMRRLRPSDPAVEIRGDPAIFIRWVERTPF